MAPTALQVLALISLSLLSCLAFGACKEKALTRPELGHLKKADASAHRHLVEFRNEGVDLQMGDTVTVETFAPGDKVKISGFGNFLVRFKKARVGRNPQTDSARFREQMKRSLGSRT